MVDPLRPVPPLGLGQKTRTAIDGALREEAPTPMRESPVLEVEEREMEHLSVSKIETATKCPLQLKLRYINKIPELEVGKFVIGGSVHSVIEYALTQKAKGGPVPDNAFLDDLLLKEWDREIAEREHKQSFVGWQWDAPPEKLRELARGTIPMVRVNILEKIQPAMVDGQPVVEYESKRQYESEIGPFLVWGYLDTLTTAGTLIDWKTSDHLPKTARAMGYQFPAYSKEVVAITKREITECRRVFILYGAEPSIEVFKFSVAPRHREWFASVAAEVWKMVKAGAYPPNTTSYLCSKKFCGFWEGCQGELA